MQKKRYQAQSEEGWEFKNLLEKTVPLKLIFKGTAEVATVCRTNIMGSKFSGFISTIYIV